MNWFRTRLAARPVVKNPTRRLTGEALESRRLLDASGFAGNDCPPELDLSAVAFPSAIVGEELVLDLPTLGATLVDLDADGEPTGDTLRWLADPDTGVDFPAGATLSPAGVLTWTPTADQLGANRVTVIGIDSGAPALADAETFQITVLPANLTEPDLAPIADQRVNAGSELVFTVSSSEPDAGETLTFTLGDDAPAGAAITKLDATTAEVRWTPTEADLGTASFTVEVTDDGAPNQADSEAVSVEVLPVNVAPSLAEIADVSANAGGELTVTLTATDPNSGQTLVFFLDPDTAPDGATITAVDANTAELRWTPDASLIGSTVEIGVLVSDDGLPPLVDAESFEVSVIEALAAPTLAAIDDRTTTVGEEVVVAVTATDANAGDTLTFSLGAGAPASATITPTGDGRTAELRWTPTAADVGVASITVVVSDGVAGTADATESFDVTVEAAPAAPVLDSIVDQVTGAGVQLSVPVFATDPNPGQTLTLSLLTEGLPAGVELTQSLSENSNAVGVVTWTPTAEQVAAGPVTVTVRVEDDTAGGPLSDTESFEVRFDTTPPAVSSVATELYDASIPGIVLLFNDEMNAATFEAASYTLEVVGGANNGQLIPLTGATKLGDASVELALDEALAEGSYLLEINDAVVGDLAGNLLEGVRAFVFGVAAG
ncbi:putative Ig domain-containing protein [Botrimarina sp.]|uniref:putative Ig domain-containing protein n=1 Tax=Botrimarina sp. TaxID=2795802 RepID=UPI0032EC2828